MTKNKREKRIAISERLHRSLKTLAAGKGISMGELVEEILSKELLSQTVKP